jgi:hypothetical protein
MAEFQTIDTGQTDDVDTRFTQENMKRWDGLGTALACFVVKHARDQGEFINGVCWFTWGQLTYALAAQGWDEETVIKRVRKRFDDARLQSEAGYPSSEDFANAH